MIPSSLLNHLWQSTLFATASGLLILAFRKNRAAVRHWLWFAASCKFLVPFSLLVMIGSHFEWRTAPMAAPLPFFSVVEEIGQPVAPPDPLLRLWNVPSAPNREPAVLLCVWLCGLAVVVCAWARQWRRVRTALRSASPMQLDLPIRVMSSPGRLEPGVFGVFRPVLLLPEGIIENLTPKQWEAILAHEMCHVRRRDNLTAAFHMAVEAIFWFHPLVWWIGRQMVHERERACDEEVLLAASDPQDYAEGILNVCKLYLESPLVCVSGVTGSNLKKRIRAIMTERVASDLNFAKKFSLVVAGIAALGGPILVGIIDAPLRAQSSPAATAKWEVVSVKPRRVFLDDAHCLENQSKGRLNLPCHTLEGLLATAFVMYADGHINRSNEKLSNGRRPVEISGGRAWISSEHWEIIAKPEGNPSPQMMRGPMLQALLEDRFKLKIHRETKEVPVYALTVAKGGPKLQPFKGTCAPPGALRPFAPGLADCLLPTAKINGPNLTLGFVGLSFDQFSKILNSSLDRPVIDRTGITGPFTFNLEFAPDVIAPGFASIASDDPSGGISIFTAIQEQLGLKLEPASGPGEFLVIDHVERPSEN